MEFEVFTLVLMLEGPADIPEDRAGALTDAHLMHLATLREQGLLLAAGPARTESRPDLRGISLFRAEPEEALRLAAPDPAVVAGMFRTEATLWRVPARAMVEGSGPFPHSIAEARGPG
jgi:uncharacterized protein YciI